MLRTTRVNGPLRTPLNGHFRRFSSISTKRHKNYIKRSSESASHTDFTPEKVFLGICMRGHASVWRFPKNWKEAYLHRHRTRSCQRSHCQFKAASCFLPRRVLLLSGSFQQFSAPLQNLRADRKGSESRHRYVFIWDV